MTRLIAPVFLIPIATGASAHAGHLADVAGHDHWIAAGAIGLAVLVGLWGALSKDKEAPEEDDEDESGEEAEA